jgi:hypothetical protein
MSNSVPKVEEPVKPVEQVQMPAEPAKELDLGTVGLKTAAITVEVVVGVALGSIGVTVYTASSVFYIASTVYWYCVPFTLFAIMDTCMGGEILNIIVAAKEFWKNWFVDGLVEGYKWYIDSTIGNCVRNVRDIWRIPVYR